MQRLDARNRIVIAVILGALIVLAGARGFLGPVRWVYDHTVVATGHVLSGAGSGTGNFFSTLGQIGSLAQDNALLERENADLRGRLAASADAARENIDLRRELGLVALGTPKQTGADVVGFQPDSYRQFVTLNKGSRDGLRQGQAAVSNGVVVGTLSSVEASTSKLQLISDPEFALTVRDQETQALGVLHGQLGGGLVMERISQTDAIAPGDTIVSSGLGTTVPLGVFVGPVQSVNTQTGGIFKSAQVTTTLRPERLRFVFVVSSP